MQKARIFNIQKFCLHDGPGVRTTVFFKGCPLSCVWCHNPESQLSQSEILFDQTKCTSCGRCISVCSSSAVKAAPAGVTFSRKECIACGACEDVCPNSAREFVGREYTVAQLLDELEKERPFIEQSGGGVTFSGGEPMLQIDFVEEAARDCRERGIYVAIDTCGFVPYEYFERILKNTNVFLYDLKFISPILHKKYTGVDNALILENLQRLAANHAAINLRLPLIEGVNSSEEEINSILSFVAGTPLTQVNLLSYHDIGKGKYAKLGREYGGKDLRTPKESRLNEIKAAFEAQKYKVVIGG